MKYISPDELRAVERERDMYRTECEKLMALPNCNTCRLQRLCSVSPEWGKQVRINCYLWVGQQTKKD